MNLYDPDFNKQASSVQYDFRGRPVLQPVNPLDKAVFLEEDRTDLGELIARLRVEDPHIAYGILSSSRGLEGVTQRSDLIQAAEKRGLVKISLRWLKEDPFNEVPLVYLTPDGRDYLAKRVNQQFYK